MRSVSIKRQKLNRTRRQLLDPLIAEGAPCEVRLEGCTRRATDGHEVKTRARGGSIVEMAKVLMVCRPCHRIITENPSWADRHGWTVPSWATEADEQRAWAIRHHQHCDLRCEIDHREVR